MATWPVRATPVLGATASPTVPVPLPLPPEAMLIHGAPGAAFQVQPVSVVIPTDSRPPAAAIVSPVRLSVNVQGAAAWLTDTLAAPTTIAPERADGTVLG